jgi:hypothetical protein
METKYCFPSYGVHAALFNNRHKALKLILNQYSADIQLPGNGIWSQSIP